MKSSPHPAEEKDLSWLRTDLPAVSNDIESPSFSRAGNQPSWLRESPEQPAIVAHAPKSARKPVMQWKKPERIVKEEEVDEDCCCCPKDPVLYWFYLYHCMAGLLAVLAVIANCSVLLRCSSWRDAMLYGYGTLFSGIIVATEMDFRAVVSRLRLLDLWLFRGLFYAYVGFITFAGSDPSEHYLFVNAVGVGLFLVGLGYSVMGLLCLKTIVTARGRAQGLGQGAVSAQSEYTEIANDFQITPTKV